jgi:SOS-response transcriptional repressor LexA
MIQSGFRKAILPPVVDGRHAGTRLVGNRCGSTERIDDEVCKSIHAGIYAEMADNKQAVLCRNGICHNGRHALDALSMEIAEIRELMRAKGYDQSDLANLLGIDPSAVSKRLTGKRPFKHNEMVKTQAWLLGGAPAVELAGESVRMLPIIGQVAAGSWKEAIQQPSGHLPLAASTAPKNGVVLVVQGDSMDLEIEDGGMVVVDPDDKALYPGHLFVILNEGGETTFKQFENDPARLVPRSTNKSHRPIQIGDGQGFTVMGRVTALYRRR